MPGHNRKAGAAERGKHQKHRRQRRVGRRSLKAHWLSGGAEE